MGVRPTIRGDVRQWEKFAALGQWGYRLMVIVDPDGNELYFPYEGIEAKGTLQAF